MQHDINAFLACDIRASYVVRRSGALEQDLRDDALKFYAEKWTGKFMYEDAYNFLKGKKKWFYDTAQAARKARKEGPLKKTRGGLGNRKETRLRENDSGTEDSGERVPGQKKSRRLLKETAVNDVAMVANHAAIAAEQALYTDRARLHQQSVQIEMGRIATDNLHAEVELLKDDRKIMGMDMSGMSANRVAYFENELVAIAKRQIIRAQRLEAEEGAARIAAIVEKAAAIEAVAAALVEAARPVAAVLTHPVAATAYTDAVDAADRANAARLVREAVGESSAPPDKATDPLVELSDGDEGDDEEEAEHQIAMMKWAEEIDAFASTRGEDEFPDDVDLGFEDTDSTAKTSQDSM